MKNTSIYNKIREIVFVTGNLNTRTKINGLAEIISSKPEFFIYYRRNDRGVVSEFPCHSSTIRQKIRFCIALGLIENEDDCRLTEFGREAQIEEKFDFVLQQRILEFLDKRGVTWDSIKKSIESIPLPSPINLYKNIKPPISFEVFRSCMYLLSICGENNEENILEHFQQKLYLTRDKYESAIKA